MPAGVCSNPECTAPGTVLEIYMVSAVPYEEGTRMWCRAHMLEALVEEGN